MSFKVFEQKIYAHYQDSLKLFFPKDLLVTRCQTPRELLDYVSRIKDVLRLTETFRGKVHQRNEDQISTNPKLYKRAIPLYMYLYNFMMNRVPTDLYRVKNPKDGSKVASTGGAKDLLKKANFTMTNIDLADENEED